jgi:hypothetical protein
VFNDANGDPINGGEGSLGHIALHAVAGCAAAEATGADCAAGAAGAAAQAIYAGGLNNLTLEDRVRTANTAELIGALAGYAASGGKAENVSAAASIARSGVINNYLSHDDFSKVDELVKERAGLCGSSAMSPGPTCSDTNPRVIEINNELKDLKLKSNSNTLALIETCSKGPSLDCSTMLSAAKVFNDWTKESWNYDYEDSFSTGGDLIYTGGDYSSLFDLDEAVVEHYSAVQNDVLSSKDAEIALIAGIAKFDGRIKVVAGVVEIAGVTVCSAGTGGACFLAIAGALVGANQASEGALEIITGETRYRWQRRVWSRQALKGRQPNRWLTGLKQALR